MSYESLFAPLQIKNTVIPNRFVVPPMGTNLGNEDGTVSDRLIAYYQARAKGGFGLIVVEGVAINETGRCIPNEGFFYDDSAIEGHKRLAKAIHDEGSKCILQIHHAGRQTNPGLTGGQTPIAPTRIACPVDNALTREITTEEAWELIEQFGDAALRAKKAGYDGVDVHGAHGYLIAQFMSTHANKRTDEFGGTFEGRMKFPLEIVKNIRKKCGEDFIISFRFSYDEKVFAGRTLEESVVVAHLLEQAGVDLLDVSLMTYASTEYMSASAMLPNGYNMFATEKIKSEVSIPVMAVGRFNNVSMADFAVSSGKADLIALGRGSLADPEYPNKVKEGRLDEISPCIACTQSCLGYILSPKVYVSCLINPVTGNEAEYPFDKVDTPKNIVVVGGGPAGLMSAWTAAKRGHHVTLLEKDDALGGQFRLAAIPPTKHEIAAAIRYYITMCRKYGVDIRMNTEADEKLLAELKPDAIILATGSQPVMPPIPGIRNEKFVGVPDILDGKVLPGAKCLVIGGGMSGVETADFLGEHFRSVTIVEMRPEIALDEEYTPKVFLMQRLNAHGVQSVTNAKVTEFFDDGVNYEKDGVIHELRGFDTVILAMGVRSWNPLEEAAKKVCGEVYVIGDAEKAGPANHATETGLKAGFAV